MRWFPVREPVSGNRYTILRVKTRTGLVGWGECAQASDQDAKPLEKEWTGRPATQYAAIDPSAPAAGALDMALLDIVGKACRAPVYRVLGGPTRHKVCAFTGSNAPAFAAVDIPAPKPVSRNQGKAYENQVQALIKQLPDDRFRPERQRVAHARRCGVCGARGRDSASPVVRRALPGFEP